MRHAGIVARRIGMVLAVAWTGFLASPEIFAQCAMCRTALNGDQDPLAKAISISVAFMVSMPFMVVASIAGWIVMSIRKAGREAEEGIVPGRNHEPDGESPDSNQWE